MDKGIRGFLFKKSEGVIRKWKKRWFEADHFKLSYYNSQDKAKLHGVVNLKETTSYSADTTKDTDTQFHFSFTVPGRVYMLHAASDEERTKWLEYIGSFASVKAKPDQKEKPSESAASNPSVSISPAQTNVEFTRYSLTELPSSLFASKAVESAIFSENSITSVPATIGNLKTLKILNLSYNKLSSIPVEISQLQSLEELNLHSNLLSQLPDAIGNLAKLQLLWVSQNQLLQLPVTLGKLTNLQKLSIAYNTSDKPLALPNELEACTASMVWLDISGNKYSELPTVITKFTTLQVLEATNNSLKKLPEEFQNLKVLQQLRLSHNELDDLPPALGECVSLQELEISFNQLNTLPLTFGKSKAFIEAHNNPFSQIPAEIAAKGSNAIKKFLRDQDKQ